jgi:peptidoglycan-associated lipoprotein
MQTIRLQQLNVFRVCLCAAPLLLSACANQPEAVEATAEAPAEPAAEQRSAPAVTEQTSQTDSLPSQLVILFEFDDSTVRPDYEQLLVAHGRYLADHSDASLRLEGHADERGTREYNVGLGERRASAVRRLLLLQGARDEQIETFSYGEERPAVAANNERGWSQNRRVEFNYLSE